MRVEEATARLIVAIETAFSDLDDGERFPARRFFRELAKACGTTLDDPDGVPEYATVGWLRDRCQAALAGLTR